MNSQCLPFNQIPHPARLFLDFLSHSPRVQPFYPHTPRFGDWFERAAHELKYDDARRNEVCSVLERQNSLWNYSPKTLENIGRMRAGAAAAVTGQQVGLFGGPLFSIFKALTAVKLAEQASQAGVDCVPVFWLATEDHDLDEVNHIILPGADSSLHQVAVPTTGLLHSPVGSLRFGGEIEETIKQVAELLGESEITGILRESYRSGETFGTGFARLFSRLFAEWGVILLDASDPDLHRIAEPMYSEAIARGDEINESLQRRGRELEAAGYEPQVKVTSSSTLLFGLVDGARLPVHRHATAGSGDSEFTVGSEKLSKTQLLDRIKSAPENFSPNVLLRPVVQDYLLPTLAYAGGAAEIAYFAQVAEVYKALLGKVTAIVPRFSATIIDAKQQSLLERYKLRVTDVFHSSEGLQETLAAASLPQALNQLFDQAETSMQGSMSAIRSALEGLDKTLVESANTAESKMLYQINGLRAKAARAGLRHSEILGRHASILSHGLYPNKTLQEREIAGIYFLAHLGMNFLHDLYGTIHTDCLDHQIITA